MNGILLIDKPADWTSHDVCAKLRGALHERRIGHAGTLDPMATGLLVVFIGRATRAVQFAETHDKTYLASLRPGVVTDTQDSTGTVLSAVPCDVTRAQLEAALPRFLGEIGQIPPMYSAIKRGGQKLCDVARRGGAVELQPRPIRVDRIDVLGRDGGDWRLEIACGKGTYVRTLCHDIGQTLGCGACMSALRRTKAGPFGVEQAYTVEQVLQAAAEGRAESLLLPVEVLFALEPALMYDAGQTRRCRSGQELPIDVPDGRYRAYAPDGSFLALVQAENGRVRTVKSFFEV